MVAKKFKQAIRVRNTAPRKARMRTQFSLFRGLFSKVMKSNWLRLATYLQWTKGSREASSVRPTALHSTFSSLKLVSAIYYFHDDSPSKTMKNVFYFIYKALFALEIFKLLHFHLRHKNCLNRNLITHFVWFPGKEKRYDIETLSIGMKLCPLVEY